MSPPFGYRSNLPALSLEIKIELRHAAKKLLVSEGFPIYVLKDRLHITLSLLEETAATGSGWAWLLPCWLPNSVPLQRFPRLCSETAQPFFSLPAFLEESAILKPNHIWVLARLLIILGIVLFLLPL